MTYYSESNKQEQDLWCKVTVYAYNSSIPSSIGYTHGRLLFGKECRILLDMFSTRRNNTQCSTTLEYEDNLKHMKSLGKYANQRVQDSWKIKINVLDQGRLVFLLLLQYVKQELTYHWEGHHKISHILRTKLS